MADMIRRTFLSSILGFLVPSISIGSQKIKSDFDYAHVDKPILNPDGSYYNEGICRRQHVIPYFNDQPMHGVIEANAKEGWLVRIVRTKDVLVPAPTEKIFGNVRIMKDTPERRKDFEKNGINKL
jgi:hypothetical protein